jgi:hypothetical protein
MTRDELLALPPTTDLPTAASAFGIGVNLAYTLHARGEFPCRVLRVGRKLRVPTADLMRALGVSADSDRS